MTSARTATSTVQPLRETARAVRVLPVISAASFAGRDVPPRRWLVKDMIPEGLVTMLSGDGGVGKSLLALQLAAAMTTATDWIGSAPEPGGVLYLTAEDDEDEVHRRLDKIAAARGLRLDDMGDLHIASLIGEDAVLAAPTGRVTTLSTTPLWDSLEEKLAAFRPRLTVYDNLADVFGGDEISRPQARQFIGILQSASIRYETTSLLLAHPSVAGMASGSGLSGSTAWNGSVRSRLYLDRPKGDDVDPDLRVLRTVKANHAASGGEAKLRWSDGVLKADGELGLSGHSRAAAEAHAERVFLELLDRLAGQGRDVSHRYSPSYAPAIFAKESKNAGIPKKVFERAMSTLLDLGTIKVETNGPPSRRISRLVRA